MLAHFREEESVRSQAAESSAPTIEDTSSGSWAGSIVGWVGDALKATANYFPNPVAEVFSQDRSFAFAYVHPDPVGTGEAPSGTSVSSDGDTERVNVGPAGLLKKTAALIR